MRIDKYLWAIRVYKTRTLAGDCCRLGKVKVNGELAKASREIKVGDTIEVSAPGLTKVYKVKELLASRVAAAKVPEFADDLTNPEDIEKLRTARQTSFEYRDRGLGRPTKKDRRIIDKLKGSD